MAEYKYDKSLASEQHNTLVMLDAALAKANLAVRPSFEILGGTAMTFHSIDAVFTVDIDLANKQQKQSSLSFLIWRRMLPPCRVTIGIVSSPTVVVSSSLSMFTYLASRT